MSITKPEIKSILEEYELPIKKHNDSMSKDDFTSPLDFEHDKTKNEGYMREMEDMKVLLGKSSTVDEFSLRAGKKSDETISKCTKERLKYLNMEDNLTVVRKRGELNGRIRCMTDIRTILLDINKELAKGAAIKTGALKEDEK